MVLPIGYTIIIALLALAVPAAIFMTQTLMLTRSGARDQGATAVLRRHALADGITLAMSHQRDMFHTFAIALASLRDDFAVDVCAVALFCDQGCEFEVITVEPEGKIQEITPGDRRSPGRGGPLEKMRSTRRAVFVADSTEIAGYLVQPPGTAVLHSVVLVPLVTDHSVSGFLVVARLNPDAFARDEIDFLEHLGIQIGTAVYQRALETDLQAAYRELRLLRDRALRQERLHAIGEVASGIVHDINNFLSPIVVYSELLLRKPDELPEKARKYIPAMQNAGRQIGTIVERLREFDPGGLVDEKYGILQINDLVTAAIGSGRARWETIASAHSRGDIIRATLAKKIPPFIGNPTEIRQVIANLLSNAFDAIGEGGTITVRSAAAVPMVVVAVSDTGAGMDAQTLHRCTEPFFTTKGGRNAGMGLATAYDVMQRHGGLLEIASEPGVGTTVELRFPICDRRENMKATAGAPGKTPAALTPRMWT